MPFEDVKKGMYKPKMALVDVVAIAKYAGTGGYTVTISHDLVNKIGNPRFIRVKLGTEEHKGMALLMPAQVDFGTSCYSLGRRQASGKSSSSFTIGDKQIGMKHKKLERTQLVHHIVPEGIVIDFHMFVD